MDEVLCTINLPYIKEWLDSCNRVVNIYWSAYLNFGSIETKTGNSYILTIKRTFRLQKAKWKSKKGMESFWKRIRDHAKYETTVTLISTKNLPTSILIPVSKNIACNDWSIFDVFMYFNAVSIIIHIKIVLGLLLPKRHKTTSTKKVMLA